MKAWLLIVIFPILLSAEEYDRGRTQVRYSDEEAVNITTGAVLKHPEVKLLLKNSESWAWRQMNYLGLDEKAVRIAATIAGPLVSRKYTTRPLYMHWEPYPGLTMRPDVDYVPTNNETYWSFALNWSF